MNCTLCKILLQLFLNLAELLDHIVNTLLLGSPAETISHRTARARAAGYKWATLACKTFSLLFFFMHRDHCDWALSKDQVVKEIWHWSPPSNHQE
jgi:hypothetical protein